MIMDEEELKEFVNSSFQKFLSGYEEILQREVTEFGTGSHVIVPQKHIGKKVTLLIHKK